MASRKHAFRFSAADRVQDSRSCSEPFTQMRILPSVALSDLSRRGSRISSRVPPVNPWRSSTAISHDYVSSLKSVPTSSKRGTRILTKMERPTFKLAGSELNELPNTVFKMENLENLVLSPDENSCLHSKLQYLPKEVGNLLNLRQLVLDTNELEEIPNQLADLEHLDTLTLSNNHLAALPEGFSKLTKLHSLHLANNRFTAIPVGVCHLENLTFLDLSDNAIQVIPEEICLLADKLSTLILYINDLEELPDCICDLQTLTTLWLGKNRLRRLPRRFGELENLDWGEYPSDTNINDNPLTTPPLEVCRKGAVAIRNFFSKNDRTAD